MMEKVELFDPVPRSTTFNQSWVVTGKTPDRKRNIISSLDLIATRMEEHNKALQKKYREMCEKEVR
jgi:2-oxoglutarate ferredoxin oxidoreductase subunit alpha